MKNRTSFNVAMRRTWLDLFSAPAIAIMNSSRRDKINTRYAFHDINAKVTHIFSEKSRADISLYSDNDILKNNGKYYTMWNELANIEGLNGAIIKIQNNHSTINDFGYRMEFDYHDL